MVGRLYVYYAQLLIAASGVFDRFVLLFMLCDLLAKRCLIIQIGLRAPLDRATDIYLLGMGKSLDLMNLHANSCHLIGNKVTGLGSGHCQRYSQLCTHAVIE